jgi:hypothetical protein
VPPLSLAPYSVVDSNGHALRVACGALDALVRASRLGAPCPEGMDWARRYLNSDCSGICSPRAFVNHRSVTKTIGR